MSKKDNSTFLLKSNLRKKLRKEFAAEPVILEAYGGSGKLFKAAYPDIETGIVFEKDRRKAELLALQRPTWAVYCGDSIGAIEAGVGNWLEINWLDADPYGSPWPTLTAFFGSDIPTADKMAVVINDGLRQKVKMNGGWDVEELTPMVMKYGASTMYENYLDVCREMLKMKAAQRGYKIKRWAGYYCGHAEQMCHYAAILGR